MSKINITPKSTIYIVDIEPVDTRYTGEWHYYIPSMIEEYMRSNSTFVYVNQISGISDIPKATTPGAFLNFGGTNMYKSSQALKISEMFTKGEINPGDQFLFTDAWNPTIIQVKYMSELLNIPVTLHGLWHAGSYDKNDFLGRVKERSWLLEFERSIMLALDYNYFATKYHRDLFMKKVANRKEFQRANLNISGWPMEYLKNYYNDHDHSNKRDLVVFPHRIAPEKQLYIFKELEKMLPQFEWVVCQEKALTKYQYHSILSKAKVVFSANLQETLGISCYEGAIHKAIPVVPDRLSYSEMYFDEFKYPSDWSDTPFNTIGHIYDLRDYIYDRVVNYESYVSRLEQQVDFLDKYFFSSDSLLKNIKECVINS